MSITWKEGVTSIAAASAIVLERAYFNDWSWPLVSSTRWVAFGLAILIGVGYLFSYVLDKTRGSGWSIAANLILATGVVLGALALLFPVSDYIVLLMITAVIFWLAAIVRHLTVSTPMTHFPA